MRVGPGHKPPRPTVTVRVHALPHQPAAKRSATRPSCAAVSTHSCCSTLCAAPQAPASPRPQGLYTEEKVHTSPSFHPSNCPGVPGPAFSHQCLGLSRPLRSPPPPSRDHFSTHRPFCLMRAPNTKTSWISLLWRPLFLFTESPGSAFCTRDVESPASPTRSPHGMPPTPARRHPCLTLHSTHSCFPFARLLLGGLGHNLILVPPPTKPPHHCALQRRESPLCPGGLSQAWPLQAPRFYLCSSRTASCPQASPGCPKRIERHFTPTGLVLSLLNHLRLVKGRLSSLGFDSPPGMAWTPPSQRVPRAPPAGCARMHTSTSAPAPHQDLLHTAEPLCSRVATRLFLAEDSQGPCSQGQSPSAHSPAGLPAPLPKWQVPTGPGSPSPQSCFLTYGNGAPGPGLVRPTDAGTGVSSPHYWKFRINWQKYTIIYTSQ